MPDDVAKEAEQFLCAVASTQEELASLMQRKGTALAAANAPTLLELSEIERSIVARLQSQLRHRAQILQRAAAAGLPSQSIEALVDEADASIRPRLKQRIAHSKELSRQIRRDGWVQWIVAHRTLQNCDELLEIISHRGRKAPVYSATRSAVASVGGGILDATA